MLATAIFTKGAAKLPLRLERNLFAMNRSNRTALETCGYGKEINGF